MCKTVRHFGVELEGYTSTNLRGRNIEGWAGVQDGSLSDSGDWCNECEGEGHYYTTCDNCYRGYLNNEDGSRERCPQCNGEYDEIRIDCGHCDGTGRFGQSEYGVEFVSPVLDDTESIHGIMNNLKQHDWNVDGSCGTHIHVDGRDLKESDIVKLVMLNVAIEPILYALVDENRITRHYSQRFNNSWYNAIIPLAEATREQLTRIMYGQNRTSFDKYEGQRYQGLNIHSWFYRGTVEFRYFEGQTDSNRVERFVELVTKIVEFAKTATYEQCLVIAHKFRDSSLLERSIDDLVDIFGLSFDPKQMVIAGHNFHRCKLEQDTRALTTLVSA